MTAPVSSAAPLATAVVGCDVISEGRHDDVPLDVARRLVAV